MHSMRAGKCEANAARVGAGREMEIVFEPSPVAMVDQVNAGIDRFVSDPSKVGHTSSPPPRIAADKVVGAAGQLFGPADARVRVGSEQSHPQDRGLREAAGRSRTVSVLRFALAMRQATGILKSKQGLVRS